MILIIRRNCPKYINVRKLIPHPHTDPKVKYRCQHLAAHDRLPDELVDFILHADTVFVGSVYPSSLSDLDKFPPHAGMNARSGLPGFIRVRPSSGRTVVIPDYSGNRFMSTLGQYRGQRAGGTDNCILCDGRHSLLDGDSQEHGWPSCF